jgi:predicted transcriptional regulator
VLEGKAFRYSPRHTEEELQKAAARNAVLELLDCKPANSLPLSYLVEILSEYDSKLLDDLEQLIERKRMELRALDPDTRGRR